MTPSIHSKLPDVGTTIFTVISALAAEHNAINLGQGFPDFSMDSRLSNLVANAMNNGHNQYVHMNGLPLLRQRIAEKVQSLYNTSINPDSEITITPGGTYAIYTALTTILQKGDEVIVFEPAYDSYIPNIEINGAVAVPVPLLFPDYTIDWELVKQKITPKTKAIIINSPHNPTGSLLREIDIVALQQLVKDSGIFIISDEVYEHLVFDDKKHLSILKYPDLYERSFVCFSFGKTYHCTGWKMGYCIAPPAWMKEFRKVHQFNCFSCHSPVQFALAEFLQEKEAYLELGRSLQQKRDFFLEAMKPARFEALPSHGSYFQLYSYAGISDEKEYDFALRLVKECGVAAIPVSAFYKGGQENKVVRFCFAKKEETLEKAALLLRKL
ncbi:methionine aminotransferase [Ferruginibacter sp. HRS2-29]|uniref:methionine aminotransferase n=1 Tax=Ferruginibacter sp. HRS2-29 TaxID=2487334 RepID=UPI0020CB9C4B|nr:methionine aminotransferase [Ferruginibacter sp. HRS2-29]